MSRLRRHGGRIGGPRASIDMNSLIDLTFLLLVTFMLTIPALEQGISIMLPRAKTDVLPSKNAKANNGCRNHSDPTAKTATGKAIL